VFLGLDLKIHACQNRYHPPTRRISGVMLPSPPTPERKVSRSKFFSSSCTPSHACGRVAHALIPLVALAELPPTYPKKVLIRGGEDDDDEWW
jgi:hypothetical protein